MDHEIKRIEKLKTLLKDLQDPTNKGKFKDPNWKPRKHLLDIFKDGPYKGRWINVPQSHYRVEGPQIKREGTDSDVTINVDDITLAIESFKAVHPTAEDVSLYVACTVDNDSAGYHEGSISDLRIVGDILVDPEVHAKEMADYKIKWEMNEVMTKLSDIHTTMTAKPVDPEYAEYLRLRKKFG